jgi:shikimate dehydrogenase
MKGTSGGQELVDQLPWESFGPGAIYDLVYNPPETPFLAKGTQLGLVAVGGLGMLVGQARDAIKIWLDADADPNPMMRAARLALGL